MTTHHDNQNTRASATDIERLRELTDIVDDLISKMARGNIGSLKLEYGDLRLSLQSKDRSTKASRVAEPPAPVIAPEEPMVKPEPAAEGHVVSAPMIGTFYVAPAPNEPPFVSPGDTVEEGQTIGIIEAMKIMNEIASDRAGTIVEVLATDGQTVEYGSPLVRVDAAVP